MDDQVGLYHSTYGIVSKTVLSQDHAVFPTCYWMTLFLILSLEFPACLPHMQVYLYPDLSLWSPFRLRRMFWKYQGQASVASPLVAPGRSLCQPSFTLSFTISLALSDISLSHTHDYLQKQIFLWHNTRDTIQTLSLIPKLMISSLFLTSQLLWLIANCLLFHKFSK